MSHKQHIIDYALTQCGFDDCRFTDPFPGADMDTYTSLVTSGSLEDLAYLKRHLEFKQDPSRLLDGVQSAIVVIKNYKNTSEKYLSNTYKLSRFAVGKDYHPVMSEKLQNLVDFIQSSCPGSNCYYGVDSRPISERSLALKAGMGFLGKNNMVIHPKLGSYFIIGVILCTQPFQHDQSLNQSCGDCRRCIDTCPVSAIKDDGTIDPLTCISYRTTTEKAEITLNDIGTFDHWVFGCDYCQEVCPHNHDQVPITTWPAFLPESGVGFEFFDDVISGARTLSIPKDSPLYRSRKKIKGWINKITPPT